MSGVRLDRLMANLGYGSRKEIALLVKAGRIALQGDVLTKADRAILPQEAGELTFDGEAIDPLFPLTVMLNKPAGYSCSHDERGDLIYDLLPFRWQQRKPAISCAGRLDKASTGQLLLTDDGELLHRIIHPKSHASKHYKVILRDKLRGEEAVLFASGSFLMGGDDKPLKPALWEASGDNSGMMILHEGRYHQIRRMFEALGNEVVTLHRFQTGGLPLGELAPGAYRVLSGEEILRIFAQVT